MVSLGPPAHLYVPPSFANFSLVHACFTHACYLDSSGNKECWIYIYICIIFFTKKKLKAGPILKKYQVVSLLSDVISKTLRLYMNAVFHCHCFWKDFMQSCYLCLTGRIWTSWKQRRGICVH